MSQGWKVPGTVRWQVLAEVAARFEKVWEAAAPGEAPDLGAHLPPPGDARRAPILKELIKVDLRNRWQRGRGADLEHYLRLFPELGDCQQLSVDIIHWEYSVRHRHGDKPDLQSYRKRFPDQFVELQRLVQSAPAEEQSSFDGVRLPGGKEYHLLERLGAGAFGEVWRAKAPGGVEIAIKKTYRDRSERPAMEMYAAKRLSHRAVLGVHAFWDEGEHFYIAMNSADGSLGKYWMQFSYPSPADMPREQIDELLGYFRDVAAGLDYLHSRGIVHRDIKPDNILIAQGQALVADLGLARRQSTGESMAGTLAYMPPEALRGKAVARSDQFSLAATYAELRMGRRAFDNGDLLKMDPPDLTGLPAAEQQAVRQALSTEAAQRFANCTEFVQALLKALRPEPAPIRVAQLPSPPWKVWVWRVLPLVFGGLLALVYYLARPPVPTGVSWQPANTEKRDESQIVTDHQGRRFYDQVVMRVQGKAGTIPVLFRLIASQGGRDGEPRTFYLMHTKVWNGLFLTAVADDRFRDLLESFKEDHPNALLGKWEKWPPAGEPNWEQLPATSLTALEAYCFARWLGGNLPTDEQWRTASGYYLKDRGRGPFLEAGDPAYSKIAVHDRLAQVGTSDHDVSPAPYLCKDMAGNGLEWTRTDLLGDDWPPMLKNRQKPLVRQRGRDFNKGVPLLFEDMDKPKTGDYYDKATPEVSFRIVLEPQDTQP